MSSTAQQLGNFQDPFNYETIGTQKDHDKYDFFNDNGELPLNPNSLGARVSDWLGFSNYQSEYDQWKEKENRNYERASINSARAWEEYLDSTKYQRMKADLEAAGLNPWLALQSGLSGSANGSTSATGGSSSAKSSRQQSNTAKNVALGIMAIAKLIAAMLG